MNNSDKKAEPFMDKRFVGLVAYRHKKLHTLCLKFYETYLLYTYSSSPALKSAGELE